MHKSSDKSLIQTKHVFTPWKTYLILKRRHATLEKVSDKRRIKATMYTSSDDPELGLTLERAFKIDFQPQ